MKDKFPALKPGLSASVSVTVTPQHTAQYLGSGHRLVLGTPALVALAEAAAQKAVDAFLPENYQTVGIHIDIQHDAATPVGMEVTATARLMSIEGRVLFFQIEASDEMELIAKATHQRAVAATVSLERLLQKKVRK